MTDLWSDYVLQTVSGEREHRPRRVWHAKRSLQGCPLVYKQTHIDCFHSIYIFIAL